MICLIVPIVCFHIDGAIVYRLGHKVFILGSGVRFPVALPNIGDVGKLVTPGDCKSSALWHYWFNSSRLHQEYAPLAQLVSALACHAKGQGFESPTVRQV